ncbi:MAG: hypothetical protein EU544_00270 [Promethearchaeota archaeon]|nr:MAG: hypothetical protein EU544_00270 [Candidatus Lokiarchaeota archaeon]
MIDRWNWSERAQKWVYVELKDGKRSYTYRKTPPEEFQNLNKQLKELNQQLLCVENHKNNIELFKQMMTLSQKMQEMRNSC